MYIGSKADLSHSSICTITLSSPLCMGMLVKDKSIYRKKSPSLVRTKYWHINRSGANIPNQYWPKVQGTTSIRSDYCQKLPRHNNWLKCRHFLVFKGISLHPAANVLKHLKKNWKIVFHLSLFFFFFFFLFFFFGGGGGGYFYLCSVCRLWFTDSRPSSGRKLSGQEIICFLFRLKKDTAIISILRKYCLKIICW